MEVPQKTQNWTTIWSGSSTPGYSSEENQNSNLNRYLPHSVPCSTIYNSQDKKQPKSSSPGKWVKTMWNSSVQFSCSVVSNSLQPHESQHTRPPCPSPTPGVCSNSCHQVGDAIQPSHPLSSPSPPAPNPSQHQGLFQSQLFAWSGQSIGVSASASVLTMNTQDWSPLGWTGWISLQSKGLSRVFSNTTVKKHQLLGAQLSSQSNSRIHTWPLEKP